MPCETVEAEAGHAAKAVEAGVGQPRALWDVG